MDEVLKSFTNLLADVTAMLISLLVASLLFSWLWHRSFVPVFAFPAITQAECLCGLFCVRILAGVSGVRK